MKNIWLVRITMIDAQKVHGTHISRPMKFYVDENAADSNMIGFSDNKGIFFRSIYLPEFSKIPTLEGYRSEIKSDRPKIIGFTKSKTGVAIAASQIAMITSSPVDTEDIK